MRRALTGHDSSDDEAASPRTLRSRRTGIFQDAMLLPPLLESLTSKWNSHTEKMVVQIIEQGANVNTRLAKPWEDAMSDCKRSCGATALHFAARRGLLEVCAALLDKRAKIDEQAEGGETPLMFAIIFSQVDTIRFLMEASANTMIEDRQGLGVLDLAMLEGKEEIVNIIVRHQRSLEQNPEESSSDSDDDAGSSRPPSGPRSEGAEV